jgi:pSer/pThr/pTyr-binding forkhead associated (FHA) protein
MVIKLIDKVNNIEYPINNGAKQVTIGRKSEKYDPGTRPPDIKITGNSKEVSKISRNHCAIYSEGGRYFIKDAGSQNHTFVNGDNLFGEKRELKNKDKIRLGGYYTLEVKFEK